MITTTKRAAIIAASLAMLAASQHSLAADENNTATGLTAAGAPLGFHGIDPVAYLDAKIDWTVSQPTPWSMRVWRTTFSSETNADKFSKQPARYAAKWQLLHLRRICRQEIRW
ncbi:MAG: hypothetical protein R3E64_17530 [Halioglobus sp.]